MNHLENAIKRVLNGDAASFEWLVREFQDPLFTLARNYLGDEASALDVVQETFLAAYENLGRFDPARGRFSTWLYAIARNKCLNVRRKKGPSTGLEPDQAEGGHDVEQSCAERELFERLDAALAGLPDRERMVFVLAEMRELDLAEVAGIEGLPLGTVKSRLSRAKKKLRLLLKEHARQIMDKRDVYGDWLASRRNRRAPDDFASRVMARVGEMEPRARGAERGLPGAAVPSPIHRIARLVLGCSLSALGVYRVVHVAVNLLIP